MRGVAVPAHEHHGDVQFFLDRPAGVQPAVGSGQDHIDQGHVGPQLPGQGRGLFGAARPADDREAQGRQGLFEVQQDDGFVVGDEHTGHVVQNASVGGPCARGAQK
jgi:hypothetical protein